MTPERAREILPIIQAHSEGNPIYFVMHNTLGETVYHKCGRNIRFDHGTYVLEIPGQSGKTKREIVLQNAADSIESMADYLEYSMRTMSPNMIPIAAEDLASAKSSAQELKKEFNLE